MNYIELHIGDYEKATAHLTATEDGIYGRLLRRYYDNEAPIVGDLKSVQRLVRARTRDEKEAVETILEEFFDKTPDGWQHKRCDEEIERYQEKQEKARASANARWSKKPSASDGNANACADAMRTHSDGNAHQTPDTSKGIPTESKGVAPKLVLPPWLEPDAWQAWHAFRNSRKGWTAHARTLSLRKLTELHTQGHDPRAVIEQSIERGWTGLFPLREETTHAAPHAGQTHRLSAVERVRANVEAGNRRDADFFERPAHLVASDG